MLTLCKTKGTLSNTDASYYGFFNRFYGKTVIFQKFYMKKKISILIIDDHPMTVDAYVSIIESSMEDFELNFLIAHDCKSAYHHIINTSVEINVAFVDINLPPYPEKKLQSGVDLAVSLRRHHPQCAIVMLSMHSEPVIVNEICMAVNPEGFVSKSDINFSSFGTICRKIVNDEIYFSPSILEAREQLTLKNLKWDEYDIKILQLIAQGFKMSEMAEMVPLSLSSIEKRKSKLKKQLIFEKGSDKELIDACKNLGLI